MNRRLSLAKLTMMPVAEIFHYSQMPPEFRSLRSSKAWPTKLAVRRE